MRIVDRPHEPATWPPPRWARSWAELPIDDRPLDGVGLSRMIDRSLRRLRRPLHLRAAEQLLREVEEEQNG